MCDASDVRHNALHATPEHDHPPHDAICPKTPLLDGSRALHRTISYASIDTVRPPSSKGVRRRINDMADNLKRKSAKSKKKLSPTHGVPPTATRDRTSDPKPLQTGKGTKRGRKATAPLRDSTHKSEEEIVLAVADSLHSGIPSERDLPPTVLSCESDLLVDELPLIEDDEGFWEICSAPAASRDPVADVVSERKATFQPRQIPKAGVEDLQLDIRPSESNMTVWDGLRAASHLFKCRLYLQCTTHPYDGASLPDTHRIEMNCDTSPVGSRYTKRPVLQTSYKGASPGRVMDPGEPPNVKPAAGIHIERSWRTTLEDDGTWGWYRDTFVPISPRLFDKMDYREFRLASKVWVGEGCVERELTFGISMLLREVEMK